jgi:hypothetical protein
MSEQSYMYQVDDYMVIPPTGPCDPTKPIKAWVTGGVLFEDHAREQLLNVARNERLRIARALDILDDNLSRETRHRYDLEVMRTCAELMRQRLQHLGAEQPLSAQSDNREPQI